MFESIGQQTAKTLTDALPGVEKTISDGVTGLQVLVKETIVPIVADVVSEVLSRADALDGASVTLKPSDKVRVTVTIEASIPEFTATVAMPLKPRVTITAAGDPAEPAATMEASKT